MYNVFKCLNDSVCASTTTTSHHARSLNEMGAVPGGAFKAFWEPV